jgi:hypothetical protein
LSEGFFLCRLSNDHGHVIVLFIFTGCHGINESEGVSGQVFCRLSCGEKPQWSLRQPLRSTYFGDMILC